MVVSAQAEASISIKADNFSNEAMREENRTILRKMVCIQFIDKKE